MINALAPLGVRQLHIPLTPERVWRSITIGGEAEVRSEDRSAQILQPDEEAFRNVLGHFPTGVTVITAMTNEGAVGMAANSFTSVSLNPPLVLFCASEASTTWPRIQQAGHFTVNVLDDRQQEISTTFARRAVDRFATMNWSRRAHGPVLEGVHAWLACTIDAEYEAGDHTIILGRVDEMGLDANTGPLLFYRGRYRQLLDEVPSEHTAGTG